MHSVGLASVSFRNLTAKEIIMHAKNSGIDGIEWGGDVHVPCGELDTAKNIRIMTEQSSMSVFSYGSYFRLGVHKIEEFESWLKTAQALGAPVIRIWAGAKNGELCTQAEIDSFLTDAVYATQLAQQYGITIALECHDSTYTDDYKFEVMLLEAVNSVYFRTLWQPNRFKHFEYHLQSIKALLPYIVHFHTQRWEGDKRYFLNEFYNEWDSYFNILSDAKRDYNFVLEFMPDDRTESLKREADCIKKLISAHT